MLAQHSVDQFFVRGADTQSFGIGPGTVPEHDGCGPGKPRVIQPKSVREAVVLHQDDRVFGVDLAIERPHELRLDGLVLTPIVGPEHRPIVGDVAEGPEPLVGEPVVAFVFLSRGRSRSPNKPA